MKISRRDLFRLSPTDLVSLVRQGDHLQKAALPPGSVRPPGALSPESAFLTACDHCGLCIDACDYQAISRLGPVAGRAEGTPVMRPAETPCHWCPGFPCVAACPTGALIPGPGPTPLPIGKARLNLDHCLNEQGILCDTCALYCPASAQAITMRQRRPELDEEACVGCGLCVVHCESEPVSWSLETV